MEPIYLIQMQAQESLQRSRRRRRTRVERVVHSTILFLLVLAFVLPVILVVSSAR